MDVDPPHGPGGAPPPPSPLLLGLPGGAPPPRPPLGVGSPPMRFPSQFPFQPDTAWHIPVLPGGALEAGQMPGGLLQPPVSPGTGGAIAAGQITAPPGEMEIDAAVDGVPPLQQGHPSGLAQEVNPGGLARRPAAEDDDSSVSDAPDGDADGLMDDISAVGNVPAPSQVDNVNPEQVNAGGNVPAPLHMANMNPPIHVFGFSCDLLFRWLFKYQQSGKKAQPICEIIYLYQFSTRDRVLKWEMGDIVANSIERVAFKRSCRSPPSVVTRKIPEQSPKTKNPSQ